MEGGRQTHDAVERGHAQGDADEGCQHDTDEEGAAHVLHQQDGGDEKADDGQRHAWLAQVTQGDEGRCVVDDEAPAFQSQEGQEQTDAGRDGMVHHRRHRVDQLLPESRHGEQDEEQAFEEDRGQGKLPGVPHEQYDGISKEGIQSHAGRQDERQFGIESHDGGGQDGRESRCGEQGTVIHARFRQDGGVDGQNIGQGKEGGQSTDDFFFDCHGSRVEAEQTLQPG